MASNHTRKTSLPSSTHPLFASAEGRLQRLKSSQEASSSSHASICQQLEGLRSLYECLDDVLQMPLSRKALSNGRCVEEALLEGSIKLLDICAATRDCFCHMKEGVKGLKSSLRRKTEVGAYIDSKKKFHKLVSNCLRDLKRAQKNCTLLSKDSFKLEPLFSLLREIQLISLAVLEASLSSISQPKARSAYKLFQRKKVSGEEQASSDGELLLLVNKKMNLEQMQSVMKQVEAVELRIQELEEGLEATFRVLLKARVSLLNILN